MTSASSRTLVRRLDRVRAIMRAAHLDGFIVTHLPNVRYLTGFAASAGLAVVSSDACTLAVDFRYATAARALLGAQEDTGITVEVTDKSPDESAVEILKRAHVRRIGIESSWMSVSRFNRLSAALADAGPALVSNEHPSPVLVPTERVVEQLRIVKDEEEIAILREAAARLSRIALQLTDIARPGRSEDQVAGEIDAAIRRAGFERPAFQTIVASGPNSALPHAHPGARILQDREAVVLDFGGVYSGYCVDLTRTVQLGAQPPELARLFDAVQEAHDAAIATVRPGLLPSEIDGAARAVLSRHGLAEAFGHGTGHGLGLEVHEEPRIGRRTGVHPETPIEAGMVFTIEPGAYVAGLGGVRIEDDVLVVAGGCEVLTSL
jgi:Xaa-Pro aminopeptidase